MYKRFIKFGFLALFIGVEFISPNFGWVREAGAATNLNGRILLQVQDKGQAWYVNPLNSSRYYLGRPDDAFLIMRSLGLGVSNSDLDSFLIKVPVRLAGRIILKVQDKGQAYYVDPIELKLYYLGRPADAFSVMRNKGLGITNSDLAKIPVAAINYLNTTSASAVQAVNLSDEAVTNISDDLSRKFSFKYKNNSYNLTQPFSTDLYSYYKNSTKTYTYTAGNAPASIRDEFYGLFLKLKSGDTTIEEIIIKLKEIAAVNNWTDDELLEFTVALVQYIPYDDVKVVNNSGSNNNPYFPYETLYLNKGVCSDKTFLAVVMLRQLGYGAAILDFPDHNHTALGVSCPTEYSLNGSGYCYVETTNYFPFGVIPQSISNGQAQKSDGFSDMFNSSSLGAMEIYQQTSGKIYQGISTIYSQVANLRTVKEELSTMSLEIDNSNTSLTGKEAEITATKIRVDTYYNNGQISEYNKLVPIFNNLVSQYNTDLAAYKKEVDEYNVKVSGFNTAVKTFYQR